MEGKESDILASRLRFTTIKPKPTHPRRALLVFLPQTLTGHGLAAPGTIMIVVTHLKAQDLSIFIEFNK